MLEDILTNVDPDTGRALGAYFSQLGETLLGIARTQEWETEANQKRQARVRLAARSAGAIEQLMAAGFGEAQAIEEIARRLDLDPAMVKAHWTIAQRRGKRLAGRLRNVEVMRLAALGWDRKRIAARFKLSARSVDRIIARMLAAGEDVEGLGQRFRRLRSAARPAANTDQRTPEVEPALKSGT